MPHIQVLESHVADLIAAGEVVERPASVVKELMENAFDAGCTALTVEIQRGGMSYIRVTDDGGGIDPADVETAFLRHATSKIRTEYDLEAIGTLGFRGEALAAIAAVSRVEVLTRTRESDFAVSLKLEGGQVLSREEAGGPQGTTMVVRDLFYNTPARLKYMKKDSAEGAAVFAAVQREALAHPEVSVRFLRDGKQELLTPGDGQLRSALYAVLGKDIALGMTAVHGSGEGGVSVEGFASLPVCCRGSRNYQFFFVNGRYVKSRLMMAALEQAYQNQRMVGKFPGCVLHLALRLNGVDVNVHPAKTEVKFVREKEIFDAVYHAVRGALEADHARPQAAWTPKARGQAAPAVSNAGGALRPAAEKSPAPAAPSVERGAEAPAASAAPGGEKAPQGEASRPKRPVHYGYRPLLEGPLGGMPLHDFTRPSAVRRESPPAPAPQAGPGNAAAPAAEAKDSSRRERVQALPQQQEEAPLLPREEKEVPWTVRGELFQTYILVEQGDKVLFIDKHAAHERLNFDRLKAQDHAPMVQRLLLPVVFTPAPEEGAALLQDTEALAAFGFDCEDFGGGSIVVRQCPDYIDAADVEATLLELAAGLLEGRRMDPESARDHLLATMACKAAIKGGQKNGPAELERVAKAVMSGQVRCCPHGRPVAVELTRAQLEKMFGRT
ncbi:MAG TPA: DNA mismatch repair endonuclease MutL [Candidatus Intestinimonas stercoravium]|nr:DNA mismatch repair endonuclease MutL [Candidatus Intestinimonas stercoravium]